MRWMKCHIKGYPSQQWGDRKDDFIKWVLKKMRWSKTKFKWGIENRKNKKGFKWGIENMFSKNEGDRTFFPN